MLGESGLEPTRILGPHAKNNDGATDWQYTTVVAVDDDGDDDDERAIQC